MTASKVTRKNAKFSRACKPAKSAGIAASSLLLSGLLMAYGAGMAGAADVTVNYQDNWYAAPAGSNISINSIDTAIFANTLFSHSFFQTAPLTLGNIGFATVAAATHSAATLNINGVLNTGDVTVNNGGIITVLSGAPLSVAEDAPLVGAGTLNIGSATVAKNLVLGGTTAGTLTSAGTLNVFGTTTLNGVTAGTGDGVLNIKAGTATFKGTTGVGSVAAATGSNAINISGGETTFEGALTIGNAATSNGSVKLTNGTATTKAITIAGNGTLEVGNANDQLNSLFTLKGKLTADAGSVVVGNASGNVQTQDIFFLDADSSLALTGATAITVNKSGVLDLGSRNVSTALATDYIILGTEIGSGNSGTGGITFTGSTIRTTGNFVSTNTSDLNLTNGNTAADLNANIEAASMTVNNGSSKLVINNNSSVKLTNETAYLNASAVELTDGSLNVAGDIQLHSSSNTTLKLQNAKTSSTDVEVTATKGQIITSGNAYATAYATLIGNNGILGTAAGALLQVATLDTTRTAKNQAVTATGQSVTVDGNNNASNVTLRITNDVSTGTVLDAGTSGVVIVIGGAVLELNGNITMGEITANTNASSIKSMTGIAANTTNGILLGQNVTNNGSTLKINGTLTTAAGKNFTLSDTANTDTFGSNLTVAALQIGATGALKTIEFNSNATTANTLAITGLKLTDANNAILAIVPEFLKTSTADLQVDEYGKLVLGANGQDTSIGGTYAGKITVNSTNSTLTLLGGKFTTTNTANPGQGITITDGNVAIGDASTTAMGTGKLTGGLYSNGAGDITVNMTGAGDSYTIDKLTLANTGHLIMTNGTLNVGTLDVTSAAASASTWSAAGVLNVGTLTMGNAGDSFTINNAGTMKVATFGTSNAGATITVGSGSAGTLDLSGLNITDLHKITNSGAAGSVQGFAGKVVLTGNNFSSLRTTGTVSYDNSTALTIDYANGNGTTAGTLAANLTAGVLTVKNGTAAQAVTVAGGTALNLYGNSTEFLNASTVTVATSANLNLGFSMEDYNATTGLYGGLTLEQVNAEIDKTKGGTSSANVVLKGGELAVSNGHFEFHNATGTAKISTDTAGSELVVTQGGRLGVDILDFADNTKNLEVTIGKSLGSDKYNAQAGYVSVTSMTGFGTGDILNVNSGLFNYGSLSPLWLDNTISREHLYSGFATLGVNNTGLNLSNGAWSIGSDKANTFGASSLTVISAKDYNSTDKAAITVSSAHIEQNAGLLLDTLGITGTHTLTVLKSDAAVTGTWTNVNSASRLYDVTLSQSADKKLYNATVGFADLSKTLPGISSNMSSFIRALPVNLLTTSSENYGLRFMARALDRGNYLPSVANDRLAAITIEGAAQMATVGAVPSTTVSSVSAISGGMSARTSIMSPLANITAIAMSDQGLRLDAAGMNAGSNTPGFGLWAMPLYQNTSAKGLKAGSFETGYNSQLYGMAIGADYTLPNNLRLGATFNVGAGDSDSTGNFNKTKNDFDFVGIGLYAGWAMNNFGLSADLAYTWSNNDVVQNLPTTMDMPQLKSDVDSSAFTLGLRGEYKYSINNFNIMPHLGLRYTHLVTDSYNIKSAGNTVFHAGSDNMDVFSIPLGVAFSKDFITSNDWLIKPQIDLGVTFNVGDVDAISHVSIPSVNATSSLKSRVMDRTTFDASLGISTEKGNLALGLMYDFRIGSKTTSHGVNALLRYKF